MILGRYKRFVNVGVAMIEETESVGIDFSFCKPRFEKEKVSFESSESFLQQTSIFEFIALPVQGFVNLHVDFWDYDFVEKFKITAESNKLLTETNKLR